MGVKAAKAIDSQTARNEVEKWLDYKRVKPKKREENEDTIETLVESFEDGTLILNPETHEIEQNLLWPIGNNESVTKLTYKPRLTIGEINKRLKAIKNPTNDDRIVAYVSALTGENSGVISMLDSEDNKIAQTIAIFFF